MGIIIWFPCSTPSQWIHTYEGSLKCEKYAQNKQKSSEFFLAPEMFLCLRLWLSLLRYEGDHLVWASVKNSSFRTYMSDSAAVARYSIKVQTRQEQCNNWTTWLHALLLGSATKWHISEVAQQSRGAAVRSRRATSSSAKCMHCSWQAWKAAAFTDKND